MSEQAHDEVGLIGQRRYAPPAPDVLVVVFGALVVGLDGRGLHVRVIDRRTLESK